MKSIDEYARKQAILDNLIASLDELYSTRLLIKTELFKICKQIEKHEEYLERLKEEED